MKSKQVLALRQNTNGTNTKNMMNQLLCILIKIFSIAMHDGDDHRSVEEGYDKAGDPNKYDNNKNEERAKN